MESTPTPQQPNTQPDQPNEQIDQAEQAERHNLSEEELNKIKKKMGETAWTMVATTHSKESRKSAAMEAANLRLEEYSQKHPFLTRFPVIGGAVKAGIAWSSLNKAEAGINKTGTLEGAFEALDLDPSKSQTIEASESISERALQALQSVGYGEKKREVSYKSRLNGETVERMDGETEAKVKEALKAYYDGLHNLGRKKAEEERRQLEATLDEKIREAFSKGGNLDTSINLDAQKEAIKKFARANSLSEDSIHTYIDEHMALYQASMQENIHTKQKVNGVLSAIEAGGLAAGILAGVGLSGGGSFALRAAGVGSVTGGIIGAIHGVENANIELSEAEIKAATTFDEGPKEPQMPSDFAENEAAQEAYFQKVQDAADAAAENAPDDAESKQKASILAAIGRFRGKLLSKDKYIEQIEEKRDRKSAKELIEAIDGLKADDPEYETKLRQMYSEIIARGRFSRKKRIDLIKYQDGDKFALEQKLAEIETTLFGSREEANRQFDDQNSDLNEALKAERAKLEANFTEAEKLRAKYIARRALVDGVTGALAGTIIGGAVGFVVGTIGDNIAEAAPAAAALAGTEEVGNTIGATPDDVNSIGEVGEQLPEYKGEPILIETDPNGGVLIGIDENGDGSIGDSEIIGGGGENAGAGIDLTNNEQFENLQNELKEEYGVDLQREAIDTNEYGPTTVGEYINHAENAVDNSGGVDWGRSATKVAFGNPSVISGDGMDNYEVPVWGVDGEPIPDGAKLYIDFDGDNGSGQALEYTIENGKAVIPADVLDTSNVGNGGAASFIGTVRVGEMDGNTMISYATAFGQDADLSTTISANVEGSGYAFTATDIATGEGISQFAVNANNEPISNLSEIFNGNAVGESTRLPSTFMVNDIDGGVAATTLASGESLPDLDYRGGYHPEFDSYTNIAFKESATHLGTPIHWDLDGDGQMSAAEEANYFRQMLVRTGTNPFMLGQNASNYGLLEPDRLEEIIPQDKLVEWGITDGVVDSEAELNILLDHLKLSENADYYDALVNATINEMEAQMQGGGFTVETVTDRITTYATSDNQFDTSPASELRPVIYPHDADGNPVGNQGWWCRKYGAEGGIVGDLPVCEQKSIIPPSNPPVETPPTETPPPVVPPPDNPPDIPPDTPPDTPPDNPPDNPPGDEPKDIENAKRIDEDINQQIADDIGTEKVNVEQTSTAEVESQTPTEQPSAEAYEGTSATIVENQAAQGTETTPPAEPVQEQISEANDYSENLGGANADQYAPVQENPVAQSQADAAEIPISQAPGVDDIGSQELNDILADLEKQ